MNPGDKVQLSGYDLMAVVNYASADSKAIVVHNNSTHILVFRIDGSQPQDLDNGLPETGIYVAAWRYFPDGRADDSHDFSIAYKLALECAIGMITGERSDET